jgi:glycerol-3-phosphate acyltransferase PlsY
MDLQNLAAVGVLAYLLGSISFSVIITHLITGLDVRGQGSGHAGATNVMRMAGWAAGALVMLLDFGKGFAAVFAAQRWGSTPWAIPLAAVLVGVGHCWPVFHNFHGGMGVAVSVGGLLAVWPLGVAIAIGVGAAAQLILRHSARANFITGLLIGPIWFALGRPPQAWAAALGAGLIVAARALSDWRRVYRELWLDRER